MFGDNQEFVTQVKTELFSDQVYVFTPKGEVISLPKGSTVVDFAYKIHSEVGNKMVCAYVNDEVVNVNYVLKNKDRVRIVTNDHALGPKEEWLDIVCTSRARKKIKEFGL